MQKDHEDIQLSSHYQIVKKKTKTKKNVQQCPGRDNTSCHCRMLLPL